jgi:hypothetical protein
MARSRRESGCQPHHGPNPGRDSGGGAARTDRWLRSATGGPGDGTATHGQSSRCQLRARRKDESLFPIEISSVVFQSPFGRVALGTQNVHDHSRITERRATEAECERLIHEFKEALARVKSRSGLLPRCASCRKARDPKGPRHDLETSTRSPASGFQSRNFRIAGGSSTLRPFAADAT